VSIYLLFLYNTAIASEATHHHKPALPSSPTAPTKMQTTTTRIRLLVLVVLALAYWTGSHDLRTATVVIISWALATSCSATSLRPNGSGAPTTLYMLTLFVALATTNDLIYYNTIGRLLDQFFTRDSYDMETPGSSSTD
jgi:hypothetical protein